MTSLDLWMADLQRAVSNGGLQPVLDITAPAAPALSRQLANSGFPGVLPLWAGRQYVVGLLAAPESNFRSWRAVILQDNQALTISSDSSTLLPQFIIHRILSNAPSAASKLGERWTEIAPRAFQLHSVLGGTAESLDIVAAAARDRSAREAFRYVSGREKAFEAARSTLCRRIDASDAFKRYADWLDACIAGRQATLDDLQSYGPWERRVVCWSERLNAAGAASIPLPTDARLSIIEGDAGVDSAVPTEPSWSVHPGGASAATALIEAASALENTDAQWDEASQGLITALVTEDESYRGLAHAEAAVLFDERGESERAWSTLQSSIWWAARSLASIPQPMRDALKFLTTRHNWSDVVWVIARGEQ